MTTDRSHADPSSSCTPASTADPGIGLLRVVFVVLPVVFGLDKFLGLLTDWEAYLAPQISDLVPGSVQQAILMVGAVGVAAGFLSR